MWKKAISVLLLLTVAGCSVQPATVTSAVLTHSAKIEISGDNRYKVVRLTPSIYNAANSDLSDLLIKDSNGGPVPYFIHSGVRKTSMHRESYPMELINAYVKNDSFYFDYRLAVTRDSDTVATSIEFATPNTGFAKTVDVYGSYDDVNWEFIQNDTLYVIDGKYKLAIEFTRPQKYTHYRLQLANNLEQVSFDTVELIYNTETSAEIYFIETIAPKFSTENDDKSTNIIVKGLQNLRLCDVTIDTENMFKRNVYLPGGISKDVYNLSLNGVSYADTVIPLNWYIAQDDTFVIRIENADDKPIDVNGISVRYYADEIVFDGTAGGVYTLEFGRDPAKRAPVYDVERYKNDILQGEIDKAALGGIHYAVAEEAPPQRDYKLIFNIVIIAITLLLGVVIVLKLRKK